MKSIIIKLLVFTLACFFISTIAAKVGGINYPHNYPQSLMDKYAGVMKEGTESSFQAALPSDGIEELEIQTTSTDLKLENDLHITANLKGSFPGTAIEAFSSEVQGKKLIIRINETTSGLTFNMGGGRQLSLKVPSTITNVMFKTVSGDADIQEFHLKSLDAETTSGDVKIEKADVGNLVVKTVSGDLHCHECRLDSFQGRSVSGDIYLKLLKADSRLEANTTSGNVEVQFAQKPSARLMFSSVSGDFVLEPEFGKSIEDDHQVDMKIGSGKGLIAAKTVSGDLKVGKF
jgi:DUF4097 and DUF4098 domain-containing protein YvlB